MMANHQITITENGTKTLLTEKKYCDRNIEVVVNVPSSGVQPTQFTNILDLDTTIVKNGYRVVTSAYTATPDGVAIVFPITAGTHKIRVRGKYTFGLLDYNQSKLSAYYTNVYHTTVNPTVDSFSGELIRSYTNDENCLMPNQDQHGDWYIEITAPSDGYVGLTLKDQSYRFTKGTYSCKPIITIDELIGNGGYVG